MSLKKGILSIFVAAMIVTPFSAHAATRAELIAQIQQLLQLVTLLQEQLALQQGSTTSSTTVEAPTISVRSASIEKGDTDDNGDVTTARATIKFNVAAGESDVYIRNYSEGSEKGGIEYRIVGGGADTTSVLTSSADILRPSFGDGSYYRVSAETKNVFTLSVTFTAEESGFYHVELKNIGWQLAEPVVRVLSIDDAETDSVYLDESDDVDEGSYAIRLSMGSSAVSPGDELSYEIMLSENLIEDIASLRTYIRCGTGVSASMKVSGECNTSYQHRLFDEQPGSTISGNIYGISNSSGSSQLLTLKVQAYDSDGRRLASDADTIDVRSSSKEIDISLTSPNGGEVYENGEIARITWDAPTSLSRVYVDLMDKHGGFEKRLNSSLLTDEKYSWFIPADFVSRGAEAGYKIQLTCHGNAETCNDVSSESFTIKGPSFEEQQPPKLEVGIANNALVESGTTASVSIEGAGSNVLSWGLSYDCDSGIQVHVDPYAEMCQAYYDFESSWYKSGLSVSFPEHEFVNTMGSDKKVVMKLSYELSDGRKSSSSHTIVVKPEETRAKIAPLPLDASSYYSSSYQVGMSVEWDAVSGAEEYKVNWYRRDARGDASWTQIVTGTKASSGRYSNSGAPGECYHFQATIQALDSDGNVIAEGSDEMCEIGKATVSSADNPNLAGALSAAQKYLQSLLKSF